MARTKEFDRDKALQEAIEVFRCHGYEATSLEDLLRGMGIARQSLYDTFGDKHHLFVEALGAYRAHNTLKIQECLVKSGSVKEGFCRLFFSIAEESHQEKKRGCLVVNSTIELSSHDPEVADIILAHQRSMEMAFRGALEIAKDQGEILQTKDTKAMARFLLSALQGMRVSAKADPDPERLREIAQVTLSVVF
jgi:TetR/AcrR family transcriptional regulator, transcriptional repressor for nem operon